MSIAQLGIDVMDIVDPGMVNVEDQAYPRPLDPDQQQPRNMGNLSPGSFFPAAPQAPDFQDGNVPVEVFVAASPFILPPLSQGVAVPEFPEIDVATQGIQQPVVDVVVTEAGSFEINPPTQASISRTILAVTSFVVATPGGNITYYILTFAAPINLMDFGIDFGGTTALFPNSAPADEPQQVPAALITSFASRQLVVVGTNLLSVPPVGGNTVVLDISRHGNGRIFELVEPDLNIFIDSVQSAFAAETVVAQSFTEIDAFPGGTLLPFIGSGVRIPPLLYLDLRETAFFPADRTNRGPGLPANVFVG
jgi:hypothetical protein